MAKKLTDIGIRNLKPAATRREISDGGTGLYLVLQPNGKRSWAVRYRFHGAPRKLTLGSMPPVMLAEARKLASEALYGLGQDIDPAAIKQQSKLATAERAQDTVERLIEVYLGQYAKRARPATWAQASGIFRRDVLPRWGGRLVTEITRKDVRELIRAIAIDRPIMANRAQAYLSRFFRWLMNEDYITGSPAVGIEHPAKENARDRALSDPEIRKFWAATHALPKPFGDIYKVLLLSGARRQEVAEMEWRELDLAQKTWKLPAQRSKSRISHILPLGPMAWDIIAAQPRSGDHVFGRAPRFQPPEGKARRGHADERAMAQSRFEEDRALADGSRPHRFRSCREDDRPSPSWPDPNLQRFRLHRREARRFHSARTRDRSDRQPAGRRRDRIPALIHAYATVQANGSGNRQGCHCHGMAAPLPALH